MKIENIIEDIIHDITDIKYRLEEQICREKLLLNFKILLPDLEKLSPVKTIELVIISSDATFIFRADIHTHNGNRVFENNFHQTSIEAIATKTDYAILNELFINMLREIIKRKKLALKSGKYSVGRYNDNRPYTNASW